MSDVDRLAVFGISGIGNSAEDSGKCERVPLINTVVCLHWSEHLTRKTHGNTQNNLKIRKKKGFKNIIWSLLLQSIF